MNIIDGIAGILKPVSKIFDDLHTSDEERGTLQNELAGIQNTVTQAYLNYESEIKQLQGSIIIAEAQGGSWLQRNWRPITMLTFLVLVVCDSFGLLAFRLAEQAWTLLQIGLGGYVVGRSAEKIVPKLIDTLKKEK